MERCLYTILAEKKKQGKKSFAVLIDPDTVTTATLDLLIKSALSARVDYFLLGGSLVLTDHMDDYALRLKQKTDIPVILFPGNPAQVTKHADALLYLSLISGRNAELLIGQHVASAMKIKQSRLEIIPTGYMVIDGGAPTTVSYISNAAPIPADKNDIALCTALAGEMLGKKIIYMDAGSGAKKPISENMIRSVAEHISVPLFVGGGIRDAEKAYLDCKAGADVIVVGNAIEKDDSLIKEISDAVHAAGVKV